MKMSSKISTHDHTGFSARKDGHSARDEDTIDVAKLFGTLWRAKILIASMGAVFLLLAGYYVYVVAVPTYSSVASVMLESREEQVVDLQSVVGGLSADTTAVNTEVEVLTSRSLIGKVVDELNLMDDPEFNSALTPPSRLDTWKAAVKQVLGLIPEEDAAPTPEDERMRKEAVVQSVTRHLSVRNVPQTLVFDITANSIDPIKAAQIADTVVELYIRNQVEVKFDALEQATSWLGERVSTLQVELEASESELNAFRSGSALISPETLAALEVQLKDLRDRMASLQQTQEATSARLAAYEAAQTPEAVAEALGDDQLQRLLNRIDSPEIAQAFNARAEQVATQQRLTLNRIETQQTSLTQARADFERQIEEQTNDLIKIQQLEREQESNRLLYEYFLNRLKETSVQRGIQQADARVLSPALLPVSPTSPKKSQLLAGGLLFGMLLGCAIALYRVSAGNTYRLSEEIEQDTGYNVLGLLPLIPGRKRNNQISYLREKPTSAPAEAFRNLRTSILLANIERAPKIIMCTSALPGEGKTTVSVGLAQNLAAMGKRVLLVEGDMRRRIISGYGDGSKREQEANRGIFSALIEGTDPLDHVTTDTAMGIDLLLAGASTVNPADLMVSPAFRDMMNRLRESYDHVIVDTPPVLIVPDARVAAQYADSVVVIVRWDSTSRDQFRTALRALESVNHPPDGVVLNLVDPKGLQRYGYGDQYGSHYGYNRGYYGN
jgi:capsular exopolysaccharide synthesis family protein